MFLTYHYMLEYDIINMWTHKCTCIMIIHGGHYAKSVCILLLNKKILFMLEVNKYIQ